MSASVNIGVFGCGYWGPNLIRNFDGLDTCAVRKVCDLSEERLARIAERYPHVETCQDPDDLFNDSSLDAITIATPVRTHFPLAKRSLESGKHTLIEKPMTATVAESEALIAIAESKGLKLMVGHTYLFSPWIRWIKETIDRGDIGEIRYVTSQRLNLGLFQQDINVVWDLAPHDISIIEYILGTRPKSVNCQGKAHITPGIEDVANVSIDFEGQGYALVNTSWLHPRKIRTMTFVGSEGMLTYDDMEQHEKIKVYGTRIETVPLYDPFEAFHYAYHYGNVFSPYIKHEEPLKNECQHFIDRIVHDAVPVSDGVDGLQVVRVLEAASTSLKKDGAKVSVT